MFFDGGGGAGLDGGGGGESPPSPPIFASPASTNWHSLGLGEGGTIKAPTNDVTVPQISIIFSCFKWVAYFPQLILISAYDVQFKDYILGDVQVCCLWTVKHHIKTCLKQLCSSESCWGIIWENKAHFHNDLK